jgi:hypothetical protein
MVFHSPAAINETQAKFMSKRTVVDYCRNHQTILKDISFKNGSYDSATKTYTADVTMQAGTVYTQQQFDKNFPTEFGKK